MRLVRASLAGLLLAIVIASFAAPVVAASPCGGYLADGEWFEIPGPVFPEGPASLTGYAVDPQSPNILWATNGKVLMVSRDGGCSWMPSLTLELLPSLEKPLSNAVATIKQIAVPEAGGNSVYVAVEEGVGGVTRPHVFVSENDGGDWALADSGLPAAAGPIVDMEVAPSDPSAVYLAIGAAGGGASTIYATNNGGGSWDGRGQVPTSKILIDPLLKNELWFTGPALFRSVDSGNTITEVNDVTTPAGPGDVHRLPGGDSRFIVYEPDGGSMSRTDDGGRTWRRFRSPLQVMFSLAHGAGLDDVVMSTHEGMWRFQAPHYWIEITPGMVGGNRDPDYEDVFDLQVDRVNSAAWGFRPSGSILRYDRFQISIPPLTPSLVDTDLGDLKLSPDDRRIEIASGQSKTVRYKLGLPPQPQPLDVFFLVDTTISMDSVIDGLLLGIHEITSELAAAKIDVQFGVGEYKDYPIPGFGDPVQGDFPYRLNRAIGPADQSLVAAIEMMQASGGGRGHFPESQLTALYQAVTGEGELGFVDPGQDAGFRPGALNVIVHMSDAAYDESVQHPSPPFDLVAQTLRGKGVLHVGLVSQGESPVDPAREDMQRMSDATETMAGPSFGGCYLGDETVGQDDPFACDITEDERGVAILAPAIIDILRDIVKDAPVSLDVTKGEDIVQKIEPGERIVDVTDANNENYDVTFKCPALSKKSRSPIELTAMVDGVPKAAVEATVVCSPLLQVKDKVVVIPPPPIQEQPVAAAVPPPPPPPAPANAQPNPNPNPQTAVAEQKQEQTQLALAGLEDVEEEELLAMVAYEEQQPAWLPLYGAAAVFTMAAAVALRSRRAAQAAWAKRR